MKTNKLTKYNWIAVIVAFISLTACTTDTVDSNPSTTPVAFNLPLENGNYWVYEVESNTIVVRDSLYISSDTLINGITYKKPKVKNNISVGFYSTSLKNNGLRRDGNYIRLTGNIDVNQNQNLPFNLNIAVQDFIIFDSGADAGIQIDSKSGTLQETVNAIVLNINYTLISKSGENYTSWISPNGKNYNKVKSNQIIMKMSITTPIGGIQLPVLTEQEVLVSNQFFAENIGMVHTNSNFSYTINQSFANQLSIPATATETQNEFLTDSFDVD